MTRRLREWGKKRRCESGTTGQKDQEKERKKSRAPDIKERMSGSGDGGGSTALREQAGKGEGGREGFPSVREEWLLCGKGKTYDFCV